MKNFTIYIFSCLLFTFLSGCRSVNYEKRIALERNQLDKDEPWRYHLPKPSVEATKPAFPDVKVEQLDNGFTIMVVEDRRLPIAQINLVLKVGSAEDSSGSFGSNHLMISMLREGTKSMSSLELAEAIANLGTEVSVSTSKDMSALSAGVLSSKTEPLIELLAAMAQEPRMEQDDFDRLKIRQQGVLATKQGMADYLAQVHFLQAAYGKDHPYGHPSAGDIKSITHMDIKTIKDSYQNLLGADVAGLIAVGDVNMKDIKHLANTHFGAWKKAKKKARVIEKPVILKKMRVRLVDRPNSPQTYLLVGKPLVSANDQDIAPLGVLMKILAGLPTSRLDENLREKRGWTYGVQSSIIPLAGLGPMMVTSSVQAPFSSFALEEILKEYHELIKTPVSEEELKSAKSGILRSFVERYNTVSKIGGILAEQFVYSLPLNNEELLFESVKNITREDIQRVAKRALLKDQLCAIAVGKIDSLDEPLRAMGIEDIAVEGHKER